MPWAEEGRDLLVLATYSGETAGLCPRSLLRTVLDRAAGHGYAPRYGIELEYTLFDETAESARAKGYRNLKTATTHKSHDLILYQVHQTEWYDAVADMCDPLRIDLAKMHEEIGGGFMEACIGAGEGLEPADQLVLLKNFMRALAMRQDKTVTFMPRWNEDADSQSIHVHMSLKDHTGDPVFDDDAGAERHVGDLPPFPRRPAPLHRRHGPVVPAHRQLLPAFRAGHLRPSRPDVGLREPHHLPPGGRPRPGSFRVENRLPAPTQPVPDRRCHDRRRDRRHRREARARRRSDR